MCGIGVPRQLNDVDGIEPGVKAAVEAAIEQARALGAEIGECELPLSVEYGLACYYLIAPAEASSNLARYDGVRYGLRSDGADFREMVMSTRHDGLGDEPKRRIMLGTYALSSGYYDAYYAHSAEGAHRDQARARSAVRALRRARSRRPARPSPSRSARRPRDPLAMYLTDVLTIPSCVAGLPGLSIPCGLSEGLPVGLQLIGPQFAENTLYRVGHALEQALAFDSVPTSSMPPAEARRSREQVPAAALERD